MDSAGNSRGTGDLACGKDDPATSLFYAKLRPASTEAIIKDNQFLQVSFYWNSGEDESKAGSR